jgi:WD40 repeat protein
MGEILGLSISKNGKFAFLATIDGNLVVWDCAQGYIKCNYLITSPLTSVAIGEDSKLIAIGSFDALIRIFKIETLEQISTLEGHSGRISGLSIFENILISSSTDSTV